VLDNFCGSGSTLIAAIEEKRDWIGVEINEKFYDIAKKRVTERLREPKLF
jgi:DNA modification methylase